MLNADSIYQVLNSVGRVRENVLFVWVFVVVVHFLTLTGKGVGKMKQGRKP